MRATQNETASQKQLQEVRQKKEKKIQFQNWLGRVVSCLINVSFKCGKVELVRASSLIIWLALFNQFINTWECSMNAGNKGKHGTIIE